MLVPWSDLNVDQNNIIQCNKGSEKKRRRLVVEEMWEITERSF